MSKTTILLGLKNIWLQRPHFEIKLVEWWNIVIDGTALFRVASKLKNIKKNVKIWNKICFCNIFENKSIIKEDLQKIQERIQKEGYTLDLVKEENEKLVES